MAPPLRSKTLKKDLFPTIFKPLKPVLFTESTSTRPSALAPNIRSISWSPTGSLITTCTSAHIRIWSSERPNVKSSTEIRNAHNGSFSGGPGGSGAAVEKVAFCPTMENVFGSTGADGGVRLWDVRLPGGAAGGGKGTALADVRLGSDAGLFLTWHPNGREMLAGTKEDAIHSIDVRQIANFDNSVTSSNWTLDDTLCTPQQTFTTNGNTTEPPAPTRYYGMAFSNTGRELFATTGDGPVQIFDYPSMTLLHTLSGHAHSTYTVQHSPRGDWLAVGGADSLITLWDTYSWHCEHQLTAHTSAVRDLSVSFDGAYVICGSGTDARDGSAGMEIYHADTGDVAHTVDTSNPVTVAAWHPLRYWAAFAGDPGGLKVVGAGSSV